VRGKGAKYLGSFEDENSAAIAFNEAAMKYRPDMPLNEILPEVIDGNEEGVDSDGIPSVYFALAPSINRMKIGWTGGSVIYRVANINHGSPVDVVLFGSIRGQGLEYETQLHKKFGDHHLKGEWFTASEIVHQIVLLPGFSAVRMHPSKLLKLVDKDGEGEDALWVPEAWKETKVSGSQDVS
jgi:hypothetical protein